MVDEMIPSENFYHFKHPEKIDNENHIEDEI